MFTPATTGRPDRSLSDRPPMSWPATMADVHSVPGDSWPSDWARRRRRGTTTPTLSHHALELAGDGWADWIAAVQAPTPEPLPTPRPEPEPVAPSPVSSSWLTVDSSGRQLVPASAEPGAPLVAPHPRHVRHLRPRGF